MGLIKNARIKRSKLTLVMLAACSTTLISQSLLAQDDRITVIEEIIISAQKKDESVQNAPLAVTALGEYTLEVKGITGLSDLISGTVPALKIQPFPQSGGTLTIGMRGVSPADSGQITREPGVGIYIDNVYLGRTQGLATDLTDLERIEILRGPQGTLYGRNVVGGAVNMISKRPSGEFGLKQTISYGTKYDELKSITHVDLPSLGDQFNTKFSYMINETDGHVENTLKTGNNVNYFSKDNEGGRLALSWDPGGDVYIDYVYDFAQNEVGQVYFQLTDPGMLAGVDLVSNAPVPTFIPLAPEVERQSKTRTDAILPPNEIDTEGHSLTLSWDISDDINFKSISAYRELEQATHVNYLGVFGIGNATGPKGDAIEQDQFSQEFQLSGTAMDEDLEFVVGLYYYEESVSERTTGTYTSIDLTVFGFNPVLNVDPNGRLIASQQVNYFTLFGFPPPPFNRFTTSDAEAFAVYSQARYQVTDDMGVTLGLRYTSDEKEATNFLYYDPTSPFVPELNTVTDVRTVDDESIDPMITIDYYINESVNTYLRYSTAYKAGGTNLRSPTFKSYDKEELESWEIGLKSDWWDRRIRLNVAAFLSYYEDLQLDFSDPNDVRTSETTNATEGTPEISGLEIEFTIVPMPGMSINVDYNYLDWDLDDQPNPLNGNALEEFRIAQAPRHAGSVSFNYELEPLSFATPSIHLDYVGSYNFYYSPKDNNRFDSRDIFNAKFTLNDINIGADNGNLRASFWVKNLLDEEYIIYSIFQSASGSQSDAYGQPRTAGIELIYEY